MSSSLSRILIIITGVITAVLHLVLGVFDLSNPLGIAFVFNGLIFLVLVYAVAFSPGFLKEREKLMHYLLMGFAALTILLWLFFNWGTAGLTSPLGIITKIDEILLFIFTWLHLQAME